MNVDNATTGSTSPEDGCSELLDLMPAYVIGATTAEETARVRALLPLCPEYAAEFADFAGLATGLALDVDPVQPPAALRARLLDAIAAGETAAPPAPAEPPRVTALPTQATPSRPAARRSRIAWALAAAAAVLLVASNVFWLTSLSQTQEELRALRQQQANTIAFLSGSSVARVTLRSTTSDAVAATVYWDAASRQATLYTDTLPPLDAARTYQLWLIGADGPQSAGVFQTDAEGRATYTFEDGGGLTNFDVIGISVEPAAGSPAPTTDPIAAGEIGPQQT